MRSSTTAKTTTALDEILVLMSKIKTHEDLSQVSTAMRRRFHAIRMNATQNAVATGVAKIGAPVNFTVTRGKRKGITIKGKVVKINSVTLKIQTAEGAFWNVSTSIVKPDNAEISIYDIRKIGKLIEKNRKTAIRKHGLKVVKRFENKGLKAAMKLSEELAEIEED